MKKINKKHLIGVLLVIVLTAGISLEIGRVLPTIGALDTPANGEVSDYYIEHAVRETASPNLVTAVLADYRGFDTLFETCVLFLSGVVVCMALLPPKGSAAKPAKQKNLRQESKSALTLLLDWSFRFWSSMRCMYCCMARSVWAAVSRQAHCWRARIFWTASRRVKGCICRGSGQNRPCCWAARARSFMR